MKLTSSGFPGSHPAQHSRLRSLFLTLAIALAFAAIFTLDRSTSTAPVQHLYYLPIIVAAHYAGYRGGLVAALVAVILYHLANLPRLTHHYQESDIIQIVLFFAVGLITGRLVHDARKLHRLATTDDLTGLHNLRSFEASLVSLIRTARQSRQPFSMLMLDVDHLKDLNDQHGHLAGAEAVRTVGHILARELPASGVACRYGGDEFVVALPGCSAFEAEEIAEDLRRAVHSEPPLLLGRRWPTGTLSVSIGVACRSFGPTRNSSGGSEEEEGERLFRAADHALYRAKLQGRNRVHSVELLSLFRKALP